MMASEVSRLESLARGGRQAERPAGPTPGEDRKGRAARTSSGGQRRLLDRVFRRCHAFIAEACAVSSLPVEFLAALVANESGGNQLAARFEPSVYRHLKAVAEGKARAYAGARREDLEEEIAEMLHPKADSYHARYLTSPFGANHREEIAASEDEALRELATSWGFTQIMGYHQVGRPGTVRDLLEPRTHFRNALGLLAEFAADFQLDPRREFAELFRCWNTGQPYGKTFDPDYVERGLARMEIYRQVVEASAQAPQVSAESLALRPGGSGARDSRDRG